MRFLIVGCVWELPRSNFGTLLHSYRILQSCYQVGSIDIQGQLDLGANITVMWPLLHGNKKSSPVECMS